MAISNFIPTVWSETLYTQLGKKYIAVGNCNRSFEGDIKGKGSTVKICGVGNVSVFDYTKDTDMSAPQTLSDNVRTLTINQAKGFNFQIDDIDRAQATPKLMNEAMRVAADALANAADAYVYSLYGDADDAIIDDEVTAEKIVNHIVEARTKLFAQNVSDANDIVIEVSPAIAALLLKAKIDLGTDNTDALENGSIGSICGCRIFVSNNIQTIEDDDTGAISYMCMARTKRAIAFAEQLSEIEAYRPEKRFADAVKGLHLYGAKVVYPKELILLKLGIAED